MLRLAAARSAACSILRLPARYAQLSTMSSNDQPKPSSGAKRPWKGGSNYTPKKKQKYGPERPEGTHDEVLHAELNLLSSRPTDATNSDIERPILPEPFTEIDLEIRNLSSTGDGIGYSTTTADRPYIVPFTLPGDRVRAKVIRHSRDPRDPPHTIADFLSVITPSPDRDDSLIRCRYFSTCSGCQFQMAPYEYQLKHKRGIVVNAYKHFSHLPSSLVPDVRETLPSPLQYAYRTKLTPHFDGPVGARRRNRGREPPRFESVPPIGFMKKGTRQTLDIEECPIGTAVVQRGMKRERAKVAEKLDTYRKGATILLRESSRRIPLDASPTDPTADSTTDPNNSNNNSTDAVRAIENGLEKTCISDPRAESTEYVDAWHFRNPANAFFQNNNSILPSFTQYIRDQISAFNARAPRKITTLIDAYSGSGLFTIALSPLVAASIGIDISAESIAYARTNAALNGVAAPASAHSGASSDKSDDETQEQSKSDGSSGNVQFLAATAADIFAAVPASFEAASTVVVIDPPRKGADEAFLAQLVAFGPALVVYVSCNVHTQARDVGWILRHTDRRTAKADGGVRGEGDDGLDSVYEIASLRGCDFFPQTGHVEGVAVLRRKNE